MKQKRKINKRLLDSLSDIPNSRYEKNKAMCEFILLCIQKMYGYDSTLEVLESNGRKIKYREARKVLFYLIKTNTALPFREISKELGSSHSENIWSAFNEVAELKRNKIKNDTIDRIDSIQVNLDKYIKLWESENE